MVLIFFLFLSKGGGKNIPRIRLPSAKVEVVVEAELGNKEKE